MSEPIPYQSLKCLKTIEDSDSISCVAISPDGQIIAGATCSKINLWNLQTGALLRTLTPAWNKVDSIAISPDSRIIAKGGKDCIYLWDLHTGEELATFWKRERYQDQICSVIISPDGLTLISGSEGGIIDLWNLQTGEWLDSPGGWAGNGKRLALSLDGLLLVSAYQDTIKIWDLPSRQRRHTLRDYGNDIAISPDNRILATSWHYKAIDLWDVDTGKFLKNLKPPGNYYVVFSPDGVTFITSGADSTINFWNINTWEQFHTIKHSEKLDTLERTHVITCIALSSDGRTLISGSRDKTLKVWSVGSSN